MHPLPIVKSPFAFRTSKIQRTTCAISPENTRTRYFTVSHTAVSSKLFVKRLPYCAQGTAAVTMLCFRQRTASTNTFCVPTSMQRHCLRLRPLLYRTALRWQVPLSPFSFPKNSSAEKRCGFKLTGFCTF